MTNELASYSPTVSLKFVNFIWEALQNPQKHHYGWDEVKMLKKLSINGYMDLPDLEDLYINQDSRAHFTLKLKDELLELCRVPAMSIVETAEASKKEWWGHPGLSQQSAAKVLSTLKHLGFNMNTDVILQNALDVIKRQKFCIFPDAYLHHAERFSKKSKFEIYTKGQSYLYITKEAKRARHPTQKIVTQTGYVVTYKTNGVEAMLTSRFSPAEFSKLKS